MTILVQHGSARKWATPDEIEARLQGHDRQRFRELVNGYRGAGLPAATARAMAARMIVVRNPALVARILAA